MLRAIIFDVDGTLADTESAHREAFNEAFAEANLPWQWDEDLYTNLLEVSGGKERIQHFWRGLDPDAAMSRSGGETIARLHASKTRIYDAKVSGGRLPLRPGVLRLINEATQQRIPIAIATTTTPANIDALLRTPLGAGWRDYFAAIADAATAPRKKPDPQAYEQVLQSLNLSAADCLALEDSQNGLRAARAAAIPAIITPTAFTRMQDFGDAFLVLPHLGDPEQPMTQWIAGLSQRWVDIAALRSWHDGMLFESA
jgi:HAD superfamily hydrolase (TIGR01509 family)